jgi:DNA repair protein RadA/Sms
VVASSFLDRPVQGHTVVFGEIGLTGEIRPINRIEQRVREAQKMGFHRCLLPRDNLKHFTPPKGMEVAGLSSITQLPDVLF